MPASFEIFGWQGLRQGDEIEVLDGGLIIARGVIEDLSSDQGILRLKLSYGGGRQTFCREDGWQIRAVGRMREPGR